MFILFLLFWIILNGRVTAEILLIGALITLFVSFFFYRLLGWRLQYDKILLRNQFPMVVVISFKRKILKIFHSFASLSSPRTIPGANVLSNAPLSESPIKLFTPIDTFFTVLPGCV